VGAACSNPTPSATRDGVPTAIAAAGDSMTRAYNVGSCCADSDAPEYSWATGDNARVQSHYLRLLEMNPKIRELNYARTGAKIADLGRQLRGAAAQRADYVTIMIGANDLLAVLGRRENGCVPNSGAMTSVASFRSRFKRALETFTEARPDASIFVASIPNIPRIWKLFIKDQEVIDVWNRRGTCEVALHDRRADAAMRVVTARLRAYNGALATVCRSIERCRWDGGAVYKYAFGKSDFSAVDYFHPSATGQRRIAEITWRAGFWA
jgi:lysophospholipase L1-like esterase